MTQTGGAYRFLMRHIILGAMLIVAASSMLAWAPFAHAATANLVVSATQPVNPLGAGTSSTSTFTLTNTGDADSATSTVVVSYPRSISSGSGITRSFGVVPGITCTTVTPRSGNIKSTCTVPALAPGASRTVATYRATGPTVIPYTGVGTSASATGPTNTVNVLWKWVGSGPADLVPSISTTPNPVIIGQRATSVVSIWNYGYSSANGFTAHVSVPGTVTSVTPSTLPTTSCTSTGGEVDCATSIANGGWLSLTIAYDVPAIAGVYVATASVDTGDVILETNETNNTATSAVNVTDAVVRLHSSSVNPVSAVAPGTVFTRTITVRNDGTADAANVTLKNYQPQTTFVSATGPAGTSCAAWYVTVQFNRKQYNGTTCTIGTMPAGASVSVDVLLSVPTTLVAGTYLDTVTPSTTSFQDPVNVSTSTGTLTVAAPAGPIAPTNTGLPVISGNANTGSILSTTNGTWVGTLPFAYSYQWRQCDATGASCTDIPGATASTYVVQSSNVGMTLGSVVTATNSAGGTSASSAVSAIVIGSTAPTNTIAPALIRGLEKQPTFLWSVTTGTWGGTPTITYAYQWQRCDLNGGNCVDLPSATSVSYVLQEADVLHQVRVRVTATNSTGSTTAPSNLSGEIDPLG